MPACDQPAIKSCLCQKHGRNNMRVPDYVQKIGITRIYEFLKQKKAGIASLDIIKQFDSDAVVSMDVAARERKIDAVGKFLRTLRENGYIVKANRQQNSVLYNIVPESFQKISSIMITEEPLPLAATPGEIILAFGKYIGYSIKQVAQDDLLYLAKLLSNPAVPTDVKYNVELFLKEQNVRSIETRQERPSAEQQNPIAILSKELQTLKDEVKAIKETIRNFNILYQSHQVCPIMQVRTKIDESIGKLKDD